MNENLNKHQSPINCLKEKKFLGKFKKKTYHILFSIYNICVIKLRLSNCDKWYREYPRNYLVEMPHSPTSSSSPSPLPPPPHPSKTKSFPSRSQLRQSSQKWQVLKIEVKWRSSAKYLSSLGIPLMKMRVMLALYRHFFYQMPRFSRNFSPN